MSAPLYSDLIGKLDGLHYTAPAKNDKGGIVNYINRNQGDISPVSFQFGDLDYAYYLMIGDEANAQACVAQGKFVAIAPFGISELYDKAKADDTRRNFEVSYISPKADEFLAYKNQGMIDAAVKNAATWFPKMKPEQHAAIPGMFKSNIYPDDTGKYPPRYRFKINIRGNMQAKTFMLGLDSQKRLQIKPLPMSDLLHMKYFKCVIIAEQTGGWFQPKDFGLSDSVNSIYVLPQMIESKNPNFGNLNIPMSMDDGFASSSSSSSSSNHVADVATPPQSADNGYESAANNNVPGGAPVPQNNNGGDNQMPVLESPPDYLDEEPSNMNE